MMKTRLLVPLLLTAIAMGSCDQPEPIPSYLRIEPFIVEAEGGAAWQEISVGWVYVNNEILGGFQLPVELPVLASGEATIQVFPGVLVNGLKDSPGLYPFMKRDVQVVQLTPGETTVLQPKTSYEPASKYAWPLEESTFDGPSSVLFESRDTDPGSTFTVGTEGAFAGKCLQMRVDTAHSVIEIASEAVALPNTGDRQVWLEMHHQGDIPFAFSILGADATQFEEVINVYLFNATGENGWNKIYFNLTQYMVSLPRPSYRLFFRVPLPRKDDGTFSATEGTVRIDNIRLIHF
jgi:hypothetical protein